MLAPSSHTFQPPEPPETNFCCLSYPVYGIVVIAQSDQYGAYVPSPGQLLYVTSLSYFLHGLKILVTCLIYIFVYLFILSVHKVLVFKRQDSCWSHS